MSELAPKSLDRSLFRRRLPASGHAATDRLSDVATSFASLGAARGILLAVSGGPDSVALMLLAAEWADARGCKNKLAVATVDHGLRRESRGEAESVAAWANGLGLAHQILTWEGEKPETHIQESAREARYRLLVRHVREIGADHLLTAHHADDQAETILFRLLRGSGIAGLAGMRTATRRAGLVHLRPLLSYSKEALVSFCTARGQPYFCDPSNENFAFARTRLRHLLPILAEHGLDSGALLRLARRAERADAALDSFAQKMRAALPAQRTDASFSAPVGHLRDEPEEVLLRLVEQEIARVAGATPLRLDRLESLIGALRAALRNDAPWRGTLGGTILALDSAGVLTIASESRRRNGRGTSGASRNTPATSVVSDKG